MKFLKQIASVLFIVSVHFCIPVDVHGSSSDKPDVFVQIDHPGIVTQAALSPDGNLALSISRNNLKIWDVKSGREIRTIYEPDFMGFQSIAVLPDGKHVLTNGLKLWDITTGEKVRSFGSLTGPICLTPDGKTVAGVVWPNEIELWDISTEKLIRKFTQHRLRVNSISISPDGRRVVSGSEDNTIKIWDIPSGSLIRSINCNNEVTAVAFSPDGGFIAYGLKNGTLALLNAYSGERVRFYWGHSQEIKSLAFSPNGYQLLSAGADGYIRLWDYASAREIRNFTSIIEVSYHPWVYSAVFTPDGKHILSASSDHKVRLWDVAGGREENCFRSEAEDLSYVSISGEGGYIAVAGQEKSLSFWDFKTGRLIRAFNSVDSYHGSGVISPDKRYMLAGGYCYDQKTTPVLKLWDVATGKFLKEIDRGASFYTTAFFADSKRALSVGSKHETGFIKIWEIPSGKNLRTFQLRTKGFTNVNSADISRDGSLVLAAYEDPGGNKKIKVWNINTARELREIATSNGHEAAFSPDNKFIACAYGGDIEVWDFQSGAKILSFSWYTDGNREFVSNIAFSHDGRSILASGNHSIGIWDAKTGKLQKKFEGHTSSIRSMLQTPDGNHIVTGSWDRTMRVWDIASGKEVAKFALFKDGEWISITPEGYYNSSERGDSHLNVRIGMDVFSMENYRESFYRPDLVKLALAGGSLKDMKNLAHVAKPPEIFFVNPPATVKSDEIEIKFRLADQGGGIGDVKLMLNGSAVLLDKSRGIEVTAKKGKGKGKVKSKITATAPGRVRSYRLKLVSGLNIIEATAFNKDNSMQGNPVLHKVQADFRMVSKPSLHALIVGINIFENPKLKLKYAAADAELFAQTLNKIAAPLYKTVQIKKLTKKNDTTKDAILRALTGYQKLNPEDVFVLYVASHGTVDEGEYFLLTSNVGSLRTERLRREALPQSNLKESIANVPSTKKLIIVDTCNAGAFGDSLQAALATRGMSEDTAIKVLSRATGSTILSASTSVQEALEGYKGHGLFTLVLSEGLKGKADKGKTGYVKTSDLADFVDTEVPEIAERVFKRKQYPSINISGQSFPIGRSGF